MPHIPIGKKKIFVKGRILALAGLCLVLVVVGLVGRLQGSRSDDNRTVPTSEARNPAVLPSADAAEVRRTVRNGLEASRRKDSSRDRFYFVNGVWQTGRPLCIRCNVGPGVVAAALGSAESDDDLVKLAIATIDPAVRKYQARNGTLGPAAAGEGGPDIQTMSFAGQLGLALYVLRDDLDPKRRAAWTEALRGAVEFLVHNGNYTWYTNGNIVLGNALAAALAWKITGDARYHAVYVDALAFAQHPPADRWPGRGLVVTKQPRKADGSDGAGYLSEAAGSGKPGFDADYVQVQADMAALIALVTADPKALKLTNLLVNRLLPAVDRKTWLLDTSRGTRHRESYRKVPFSTSALTVLANNGRADLAGPAVAQAKMTAPYLVADQGAAAYAMWGTRLAPLVMALR